MKIMRSNLLKLTVIVAVLATSGAFGWPWKLPLINSSPYPAWVTVSYPGCSSDNVVIQPSKTAMVNAHDCLVNKIGVALVTVPGDTSKNIYINWEVSGHRDFVAIIAKQPDGTFNINALYGKDRNLRK